MSGEAPVKIPSASCTIPMHEPDVASLRAAQQALATGSLTPLRCQALSEAVDTMVSTSGKDWLLDPDDRGLPLAMFFAFADELWVQSRKLPAPAATAVLVGAMASMVGEVISASRASAAPASPLLIGASGAVARFRKWCHSDEPGQERMLLVGSYGLISAASRIAIELSENELDEGAARLRCDALRIALQEMLLTVEQLTQQHPPDSWWGDQEASGAGEASTLVRSLGAAAWIGDTAAQLGYPLPPNLIAALKCQLEALWPYVAERPLDAAGVLCGLAHCSAAWSSAVSQGRARGCEPALTTLWYARQLWGRHNDTPQAMVAVCSAIRATIAVAAHRLGPRDDTRCMRAGGAATRLFVQVAGRSATADDDALTVLCDLAAFCAIAAELRAVGTPQAVRDVVASIPAVWTAQLEPARALGRMTQATVDLCEAVCDLLVGGGEDLTAEAVVLVEQLEALSTFVPDAGVARARVFAAHIQRAANILLHGCETLAARGGSPPKLMWWRAASLVQWAQGQLAQAPQLACLRSVDLG